VKIFLIGLPGSGKTTIGKHLAERLSLPFIDLDFEIEKAESQTVQKIFAERKENYFREIESKTLKGLCTGKGDFVLATGGGTPCFYDNIEVMNNSGKTIFIDVQAAEIVDRLSKTILVERPLFAKLSPEQLKDKIQWLRSQRIPFYRQAGLTINSDISMDELVSKITYYIRPSP